MIGSLTNKAPMRLLAGTLEVVLSGRRSGSSVDSFSIDRWHLHRYPAQWTGRYCL